MNNQFDVARRNLSILSLLLLAPLVLSSCANAPTAAVSESTATAEAGYGRAFGQVTYIENGKEKKWGMSWNSNDSLTLFVRSVSSGQMQYLDVERDGSFFWPLKSGDYVLAGYRVTHNNAHGTARLWLSFSVPEPGQAIYIGDLLVSTSQTAYRFGIVDNYD